MIFNGSVGVDGDPRTMIEVSVTELVLPLFQRTVGLDRAANVLILGPHLRRGSAAGSVRSHAGIVRELASTVCLVDGKRVGGAAGEARKDAARIGRVRQ